MLGDDLERLSDSALVAVVEQTDVFARVNPAQKNRVIRALKRKRHVVGYLGDGINDAPSLHSADVGISVSNGVDVARAAADIILLEKSLAAIYRGVIEGRRSFGNITKYILMGTSSNFGNMLSMAVAAALLPFLPLLPAQILLNNFLYDVSQLTHSHRQRRRELGGPAAQMGPGDDSALHVRPRSDQLAVRLPHLRRHAVDLPRWSGVVPRRLVHRVAGDPDAGHFRHSHGRQSIQEPSESAAGADGRRRCPGGAGRRRVAAGWPARLCALPPLFFGVLVVMTVTYLGLVQVLKRRFYAASDWQAA